MFRTIRMQENDRCLRIGEPALLLWIYGAKAPDHRQIARHERERFRIASLRAPQEGDGIGIRGVTGDLIPA